MLRIKTIIYILFVLIALEGIGSCTKENNMSPPIHYSNRVAQDFTYRKGKWYSISDGAGYGFTVSPLLDTIWFVSDSIAGWTHSVPTDLHAYSFRKTYFKDFYHLVFLAPNIDTPAKFDTAIIQCGMTVSGDTFALYWDYGYGVFLERYVKMKE